MNKKFILNKLMEAKNILRSRNFWIKGQSVGTRRTPTTYYNCYCATGALGQVASGNVFRTLLGKLEAVKPSGFNSVVAFNDDTKTRYEDVIAMFDRAINKQKAML